MVTLLAKIIGMCVLNAVGMFAAFMLVGAGAPVVAGVVIAATLLLDWIYLSGKRTAAKYLAPGIVLLAIFQLFTLGFSVYVAFTNYGQGHLGSKQDAIVALETGGMARVEETLGYPLTVVERDGALFFLLTAADGTARIGNTTTPLAPVPDAVFDGDGKAIEAPGYQSLKFADLLARQAEVLEIAAPISSDPADGEVRTSDGRMAFTYRPILVYDPATDAMVNTQTGTVYTDNGKGSFESASGEMLLPGWWAIIGIDNFRALTGLATSGPTLLGVFGWTFAYALIGTTLAFLLGTFLALVFNDPRVRGRRLYRVVFILPFAFPAFLSITVWSGMLNPEFGFINRTLLGGAYIPWLTDPWLARLAVIVVGLWLDFPYFFLVATGALQSIPVEVEEAAVLDGTTRWQLFRDVRLPLLLVSLAPLLIAAFAATFNNFNLIWLLNKGGPTPLGADLNLGATDILITAVYRIAFVNSIKDYGQASALAAIIFVIIGAISVWSFRRTKRLEEIF
jgi:arabinogalactan oligomer/maltooligosaccharide transport system permease protein